MLYAAWAEAGLIPVPELLNLRKVDSELEGHPTPVRTVLRTELIVFLYSAKIILM